MRSKAIQAGLLVVLSLATVGCEKNQGNQGNRAQSNVVDASPKAKPHYRGEEKGVYLYVSDLSDDEKRAGKQTGDVVQFRYLGEEGGFLTLREEDASGALLGTVKCARDCHFLTLIANDGTTQRMEFDKSSIAGSAMDDAINGFMMPTVVDNAQSKEASAIGMEHFKAGFTEQEKQLVSQAENLSDRCRDGGGSCDESQAVVEKLKKMHICYGPYKSIEADKKWMRCTPEDDAANG